MLSKLTQSITRFLIKADSGSNINQQFSDNALAISALLCEVSNADDDMSKVESQHIVDILIKLLKISQQEATELLQIGTSSTRDANSLFEFTTELENLSQDERIALIKSMWEVAYADDYLDPIEEGIIRKVAKLLYVEHSQFIKTKLAVNKLSVNKPSQNDK